MGVKSRVHGSRVEKPTEKSITIVSGGSFASWSETSVLSIVTEHDSPIRSDGREVEGARIEGREADREVDHHRVRRIVRVLVRDERALDRDRARLTDPI